jgi:hypothetical protein
MIRTAALVAALATFAGFFVATARAERPSEPRLLCRIFEAPLTGDAAGWDSADPSHPIGAWIEGMREQGWGIHSVELSVAQKPTGYPQGFQQVCLSPR